MDINVTLACEICSRVGPIGLPIDYFAMHENISRSNLFPFVLDEVEEFVHISHRRPPALEVWGIGLTFVTLILSCSVVGICVIPLLSKKVYNWAIIYFIGLGVGSLSGSAAFNLIPKAFGLATYDLESMYLFKSMMMIAGVYMFFFVDKFMKISMEMKKIKARKAADRIIRNQERDDQEIASHKKAIMNRAAIPPNVIIESPSSKKILLSELNTNNADQQNALLPSPAFSKGRRVSRANGSIASDDENYLYENDMRRSSLYFSTHSHLTHDLEILRIQHEAERHVIAPVAWMIIFGDGLHKFVDGMSIGAAFSGSIAEGISLSLAVLCEEFPHELGDVAILLTAGMSLKQALGYNLMSAAGCYCGFITGVILGTFDERFAAFIFALAGGMFLYISLASMIPEMNETMEEEMSEKFHRGLLVMLLQVAGIFTGLAAMFVLQYYGVNITFS